MKDRIDIVKQQNIDSCDAIFIFRLNMQLADFTSKMLQQCVYNNGYAAIILYHKKKLNMR